MDLLQKDEDDMSTNSGRDDTYTITTAHGEGLHSYRNGEEAIHNLRLLISYETKLKMDN